MFDCVWEGTLCTNVLVNAAIYNALAVKWMCYVHVARINIVRALDGRSSL